MLPFVVLVIWNLLAVQIPALLLLESGFLVWWASPGQQLSTTQHHTAQMGIEQEHQNESR